MVGNQKRSPLKESASIPVRLLESYFPSIRDKGFLLLLVVATPPKITTKAALTTVNPERTLFT